ncbi:Transforming growth factor beta-1-induced transcript 1 protein [Coemansia spiralis]|uniref:Transforming growth factor beta-1-induced transcript 1 protein n=2 Tax=Coemansia TaxID=4863 RepID=A0A9W8GA35_9FUNG|nr:Transforming growth factor beta-1-induced transcript 1 protein [Coemansia umbellata]KAJ2624031.1 Transforming growth factor beta-1-induced transcript 1 protein [Coemansia sp. RSA 1358]KAJ2679640.1 Transforming growth factor beta-1-induced transcript 1 protein [Coemansia spiralis]
MSDSTQSGVSMHQKQQQQQVQQSNMAAFLSASGLNTADIQTSDNSQPLAEALRTGDRETIEAIVQKLTGQLESLKMESLLSSQLAALSPQSSNNAFKDGEERQRRRQSLFPGASHSTQAGSGDTETSLQDKRKRATVAVDLDTPIAAAAATDLVCAYCGTSLDDVTDAATKATLSSEIGYCCSNCESILNFEAPSEEPPTTPLPASVSTTTAPGSSKVNISAAQLDGDYVSLNAFSIDNEASTNYFDASGANTSSSAANGESRGLCGACRAPLGDEYVNILGRRFHVMHFVCDDCSIPLYALGGYLQDPHGGEKFYCQRDYLQRFSPICHACSVQITSGEMAVALGRTYHSECFVCSICQSPFIGDVCFEHDSQPLCEWHWYIQNGLLCSECGGIIKNQCVLTRGKKYHQTCAEAKYGEPAITFEEARRQLKSGKPNTAAAS